MINLLPPDIKEGLVYARRNLALIKWSSAVFVGVMGIAIVVLAGQFYIDQSTKTYAAQVQAGQGSLKSQKLEETQKDVQDISSSVKLTLQVLSREVLFSKMLQGIGGVMPPGASLQNLSISKLEGGIDLQVQSVDYQTATQVQVNLQDPKNKIFEKADIINVSCLSSSRDKYPCTVTLRALFAKNNPFLFTAKPEAKP